MEGFHNVLPTSSVMATKFKRLCFFYLKKCFFRGMALPRNQSLHSSTHICGKRKARRAAGRPSYRTEQASVTTDRALMHDGMRGGWQSGLQMSKLKQLIQHYQLMLTGTEIS